MLLVLEVGFRECIKLGQTVYTSKYLRNCYLEPSYIQDNFGSSVLSVINFAYESQKFENLKPLKSLLNKGVRQKG